MMNKLPDSFFEGKEVRRVKTRAELDAQPDPEGAWWRAWHARGDAAWETWRAKYPDEETAALEWDKAMLSIFPQPHAAYVEELYAMTVNERIRLIHGYYCLDDEEDS